MGIFDKLFNRQQSGIQQHEALGTDIFDLIFDWFKESGRSVKEFEDQFYHPIIAKIQKDERKSYLFEKEKDLTDSKYYIILAAYYLVYQHPAPTFLQRLMQYIFSDGAYFFRETFGRENFLKFADTDANSNILITGHEIIRGYQAVKFKKDSNFSYISSVANSIGRRAYYKGDEPFQRVFNFITTLRFDEKIYYILEVHTTVPYRFGRSDEFEESNQFEEEIKTAFNEAVYQYNEQHLLHLSADILWDFHLAFHTIEQTEKWNETDYKKRKYLKAYDFPSIVGFIEQYRSSSNETLQNILYLLKNKYIDKDKHKIYKETLSVLIKNSTYDLGWISDIVSDYDQMTNYTVVFNHLIIPLIDQHAQNIPYDSTLVGNLIPLVFRKMHGSSSAEGLKMMQKLCQNIEDITKREFEKLKFTELISDSYFKSPQHYLTLDSKSVMTRRINILVEQLNLIVPTGLKSYKHQSWYPYDDEEFLKLNMDGQDVVFSFDLVLGLNRYFSDNHIGYQLMPIPMVAMKDVDRQDAHISSLALVNRSQFDLLMNYINDTFPDLSESFVYNNATFSDQDSPPLYVLASTENTSSVSTEGMSIEHDGAWAWFANQYLNELTSKEQWFQIIPVLSGYKSGKKTEKVWLNKMNNIVEPIGSEQFYKELAVMMPSSLKEDFWFQDSYLNTLKGIISFSTSSSTEVSLGIVRDIITAAYTKIPGVGPRSAALGNFALKALTMSGEDKAFGILNILRNKTKYQRFIKVLDKYIDQFASFTDTESELLADQSVPTLGFIENTKVISVEDYRHLLTIEDRKVKKSWVDSEVNVIKTIPHELKENHPKRLKEVNEEVRQVTSLFKDLKSRIKTYWVNNRKWKAEDWHKHLFNHPLVYPWIEGLVWKNETTGEEFIVTDRQTVSDKQEKIIIRPEDTVSLWHPIDATQESISIWQQYILTHGIVQPERQVFREHYPFSDTEKQLSESPRFANHFLEVKKLMAVANASGWIFTYVHEDVNWPRIYLRSPDLTAHIRCEYSRFDDFIPTKNLLITQGDTTKISYASKNEGLLFSSIPEKTLSEICRDIDLFIATTSIAHNPELAGKSEILGSYRNDFLVGNFSENANAAIRKGILPGLLDKLKVPNYDFEGNFLVFSGKHNKYRINLGSGFTQLHDSQKHITLLPDTSKVKRKYSLPLIEDETLNIIIATILFLYNDDQISDEKILDMIR